VQRVLSVSFTHVLRTLAILLLPLSFISLIAWATAGSATGNTSDPIRAAIWLWVGAHHIPFSLSLAGGVPGYLSYLPIGAVVIPFLALRSGFSHAINKLHMDYHSIDSVRIIFATIYTVFLTLFSFLTKASGISPKWYLAPIFGFVIAYVAAFSSGSGAKISKPLILATQTIALALGVSFIYLGVLIFINLKTITNLTTVLQPGIFGGVLLLLVSTLYLPNAAIALLSYFLGTGFAVGSETNISPFTRTIDQIPAFPILGVIPESTSKYALFAIVLFIGLGALHAVRSLSAGNKALLQSSLLTILLIAIISYLASGALITQAMGSVGVSIWKMTLAFVLELGVGAALVVILPAIFERNKR
jgi:hypothetical protein